MSRNDRVIDHLMSIGEDYGRIDWILKDGLYQPLENSQRLVADIVLGYRAPHIMETRYAVPIRIIYSQNEVAQAIDNIHTAGNLIKSGMGINCTYGRVIQYVGDHPLNRKVSL